MYFFFFQANEGLLTWLTGVDQFQYANEEPKLQERGKIHMYPCIAGCFWFSLEYNLATDLAALRTEAKSVHRPHFQSSLPTLF